jgi:hypothetical protein
VAVTLVQLMVAGGVFLADAAPPKSAMEPTMPTGRARANTILEARLFARISSPLVSDRLRPVPKLRQAIRSVRSEPFAGNEPSAGAGPQDRQAPLPAHWQGRSLRGTPPPSCFGISSKHETPIAHPLFVPGSNLYRGSCDSKQISKLKGNCAR